MLEGLPVLLLPDLALFSGSFPAEALHFPEWTERASVYCFGKLIRRENVLMKEPEREHRTKQNRTGLPVK